MSSTWNADSRSSSRSAPGAPSSPSSSPSPSPSPASASPSPSPSSSASPPKWNLGFEGPAAAFEDDEPEADGPAAAAVEGASAGRGDRFSVTGRGGRAREQEGEGAHRTGCPAERRRRGQRSGRWRCRGGPCRRGLGRRRSRARGRRACWCCGERGRQGRTRPEKRGGGEEGAHECSTARARWSQASAHLLRASARMPCARWSAGAEGAEAEGGAVEEEDELRGRGAGVEGQVDVSGAGERVVRTWPWLLECERVQDRPRTWSRRARARAAER